MRICCFGGPTKSDAQEHDFSDLLASGATVAAVDEIVPTAEVVIAPIADKQAHGAAVAEVDHVLATAVIVAAPIASKQTHGAEVAAAAVDQALATAGVIATAPIADKAARSPESAPAGTVTEPDAASVESAVETAEQKAGSVTAEDVVLQPSSAQKTWESTARQTEQSAVILPQPLEQVTLVKQKQHACLPQEADPTVLMPAVKYFVHEVTDNHRLAIDQLLSSVCQQLGEGGVRSVQGEYESDKAVPPSNTILGHLNKNFDFTAFFKHAQQLPAQVLMVLLVLRGQKTNASKQQPVSVSLRKARRIRAAAEKYLSSNSVASSPQQQGSSPRLQLSMDADKFRKLLLETDPSAYTMVDSSITQYNRDSYTGRDSALSLDTAVEVLATASAATRDQFSSRFSEASVDSQSCITYADMKKCLSAIHRLRHQEGSVIRVLLRSEANDMSATKGVAILRQFAAEYVSNAKYATNPELPVRLPAQASPPCSAALAVRRVSSDAQKQLQPLPVK